MDGLVLACVKTPQADEVESKQFSVRTIMHVVMLVRNCDVRVF